MFQLESFMESIVELGAGELAWRQALEKAKANVKWLSENDDVITSWLHTVAE